MSIDQHRHRRSAPYPKQGRPCTTPIRLTRPVLSFRDRNKWARSMEERVSEPAATVNAVDSANDG